jgi:hypothetical protein
MKIRDHITFCRDHNEAGRLHGSRNLVILRLSIHHFFTQLSHRIWDQRKVHGRPNNAMLILNIESTAMLTRTAFWNQVSSISVGDCWAFSQSASQSQIQPTYWESLLRTDQLDMLPAAWQRFWMASPPSTQSTGTFGHEYWSGGSMPR